jgi:hypothetical protein
MLAIVAGLDFRHALGLCGERAKNVLQRAAGAFRQLADEIAQQALEERLCFNARMRRPVLRYTRLACNGG